jgi:hypothetical protein
VRVLGVADADDRFAQAVRRKLILEIAGLTGSSFPGEFPRRFPRLTGPARGSGASPTAIAGYDMAPLIRLWSARDAKSVRFPFTSVIAIVVPL